MLELQIGAILSIIPSCSGIEVGELKLSLKLRVLALPSHDVRRPSQMVSET